MLQHADIIQISSSNNIKIIVFIQIEVASTDLFGQIVDMSVEIIARW